MFYVRGENEMSKTDILGGALLVMMVLAAVADMAGVI